MPCAKRCGPRQRVCEVSTKYLRASNIPGLLMMPVLEKKQRNR